MSDIEFMELLGQAAARHSAMMHKTANLRGFLKSIYNKHKRMYHKLVNRYGRTGAGTVAAAFMLGAPIPGPGTGLITAAPVLGINEALYRANLIGNHPEVDQTLPPKRLREPIAQRIEAR